MDTLGIEPRASRMLSGCDTTTPRALELCHGQGFLGQTGIDNQSREGQCRHFGRAFWRNVARRFVKLLRAMLACFVQPRRDKNGKTNAL